MQQFTCKLCNYSTSNKANYNKHCNTKKHKEKSKEESELVVQKIPEEHLKNTSKAPHDQEHNVHKCEYCGNNFSRTSSLTKHYKRCSMQNNLLLKNKNYEKELQHEQELHKKDIEQKEMYKKEMEYYKEMLNIAGGMVQKTVSALTYIVSNYEDAPSIQDIEFDQIRHIKDKPDDILISEIFYQYNNNKLGKYIGDAIVKVYKSDDPMKQSIWNTDTSRSTYLLKKIIYDDKSKWIVDKRGVDTTECIIVPVVKKIRELAIEYQQNIDDCEDTSKIMIVNDVFVRLVADIDNKSIHKDILKYMSPYFFLNDETKNIVDDKPSKKKKKTKKKAAKLIEI